MAVPNDRTLPWRVMTLWQQIDGEAICCEQPSLLVSAEMLDPKPSSNLGRFVDYIASLGFNALDLIDHRDEHTAAIVSFARYLKDRGISLFLGHSWNEFEKGGREWVAGGPIDDDHRTSPKLCPFNPQLRRYWQDVVAKEFESFPQLGGYQFTSTEYHYANGTPWMCQCQKCQPLTRQERFIVAVEFLAGLLAPHGAALLWNNHQDDPWGQFREAEVFSGLTGRLPNNAQAMFSETYWDQEPGWPSNHLFDHLQPPDAGQAPYLVRVQLPGQYRGMAQFPCCMVDEWAKTFGQIRRLKLSGFWVQAFLSCSELDHPLNLVNWYALSRYASDPDATAEQIMTDWASETYGPEAGPTVLEILRLSYEVSVKVFMCEGLMASHFSSLASLGYLDSHMCGPYRQAKRAKGRIGLEFPLDMYPRQRAAKIKAEPSTRLLFGSEPITPELKSRAIADKDQAIQLLDKMITLWQGLQDKVDAAVHEDLLNRLRGNHVDAKVFRAALDLYFDCKLGALTDERIDEVLASFQGLSGVVVPDPVGPPPTTRRSWEEEITTNLRSFADELRRELHKPWLEEFFEANPKGLGVGLPP